MKIFMGFFSAVIQMSSCGKTDSGTSMCRSVVLSTDNGHWYEIFRPKEDSEVCLQISQSTKH